MYSISIRASRRFRFFPAAPFLDHWGRFEFELAAENAPELRTKRSTLRLAQALNLLREVLSIERQVRVLGRAAQRHRLLLGPPQEVLVVKFVSVRHDCPNVV